MGDARKRMDADTSPPALLVLMDALTTSTKPSMRHPTIIGTLDAKTGTMLHSLHHLAEPMPEVKDHADEQPEIVRELTALHEAWEKNLN